MGDLKPINTTTAEGVSTITLAAVPENFAAAQEQVRSFLDSASCSMRTLFELDMVVEEIFINVASYAYPDGAGTVSLDLAIDREQNFLYLTLVFPTIRSANSLPISPLPLRNGRSAVWEFFLCRNTLILCPTNTPKAKTA